MSCKGNSCNWELLELLKLYCVDRGNSFAVKWCYNVQCMSIKASEQTVQCLKFCSCTLWRKPAQCCMQSSNLADRLTAALATAITCTSLCCSAETQHAAQLQQLAEAEARRLQAQLQASANAALEAAAGGVTRGSAVRAAAVAQRKSEHERERSQRLLQELQLRTHRQACFNSTGSDM